MMETFNPDRDQGPLVASAQGHKMSSLAATRGPAEEGDAMLGDWSILCPLARDDFLLSKRKSSLGP